MDYPRSAGKPRRLLAGKRPARSDEPPTAEENAAKASPIPVRDRRGRTGKPCAGKEIKDGGCIRARNASRKSSRMPGLQQEISYFMLRLKHVDGTARAGHPCNA
ncbi:hypothetical protein SJA_C2-03750 [Sphingobium indicum UT26S]|uniref:Uncharacterized protein n=1 Tax=Sphingobium indicum (strain DSM 16413 / CCM 7287 / MTCC 6362 / UT26 / NBRC 101211 / UT26S) TaxID=452662 RepID=D4Z8B9_SPHIU|nr:hypothetical protein SJA_C2-03750 [Sphingobium indicum UT26S]